MGQVQRCLRRLTSVDEHEKQRRYEAGMKGVPVSLRAKYEIKQLLFEGSRGQVFEVKEAGTARKLVLKTYWKNARSFQFLDVSQNAMAVKEMKECRLRHSHLASYYHFSESKDLFCTIMDHFEGGTVRNHMQRKLRIPEHAASKIFKQMLAGIAYLHSKNIVHRDLRLEQFMFTRPKHGKVRLCDLMHIARPQTGFQVIDKAKPVVLLFAAPESLGRGEYSAMSDMWSAGCMLFELVYGHTPYTGEDQPLVYRILEQEPLFRPLFSEASSDVVRLLKGILLKDPYERFTAVVASRHNWFGASMKISAKQAIEEQKRRKRVQDNIEELESIITLRDMRENTDGDMKAQQKMQSQFSKSLTGTYSHISMSTVSDEEEKISIASSSGPDSDQSEDWALQEDRSDLDSGPPPSGDGSMSATFENSLEGFLARTKGDWDEFDSANFESDAAKSSLWSEAEYSDWTADEGTRRLADKDFRAWTGAAPDSPRSSSSSSSSPRPALQANRDTWGASSSSSSAAAGATDSSWGSSSKNSATGSSAGNVKTGLGEHKKEIRSSQRNSWGRSSSDLLDESARDRSEPFSESGSGSSGSKRSSAAASSSSSAPWEFTERSGDCGNSGSAGADGWGKSPQHGKAKRAKKKPEAQAVQKKGSLPPIAEGEQLIVKTPIGASAGGAAGGKGESLGELTNRALASASPWDGGAAGSGAGGGAAAVQSRAPQDQGFISMSRRSSSSSGSSRPGDGSQRSSRG